MRSGRSFFVVASLLASICLVGGCSSDTDGSSDNRDAVEDVDPQDDVAEDGKRVQDTDKDLTNDTEQDGMDDSKGADTSMDDAQQMLTIEVSFENLLNLKGDYIYELWFIVDDEPVSISRFLPENPGEPIAAKKSVAKNASAAVVTIEPTQNDDPDPSKTHILAGQINTGTTGAGGSAKTLASAELTTTSERALGTDFSDVSGDYILKTPTTESTDDYNQGIWFLDPSGNSPVTSLDLPELPEGWTYEGWVVNTAVNSPAPTTTGRFRNLEGTDSDGAGDAAGPKPAPSFPGQDFIDPSLDLANGDYQVVISVEPKPDNSEKPFTLKPLLDRPIEDVGAGTLQSLTRNDEMALPAGSIDYEYQP